jgi:hypothetical protein
MLVAFFCCVAVAILAEIGLSVLRFAAAAVPHQY